jgi:hypothetical protein
MGIVTISFHIQDRQNGICTFESKDTSASGAKDIDADDPQVLHILPSVHSRHVQFLCQLECVGLSAMLPGQCLCGYMYVVF